MIKPAIDIEESEFYDDFINSFSTSGSVIIDCRCGRIHVADDEIDCLEEEELEELRKIEEKDPNKVVHWGYASISWTWINGEQVVFECPCGFDKMVCAFIEEHQSQILSFIGKMVKTERTAVDLKERKYDSVIKGVSNQ